VVSNREQLSVVNPPVAAIRQTGILPRLVYLLKRDDNRALQYEVGISTSVVLNSSEVLNQRELPRYHGLNLHFIAQHLDVYGQLHAAPLLFPLLMLPPCNVSGICIQTDDCPAAWISPPP
jgi:hypothetical protein